MAGYADPAQATRGSIGSFIGTDPVSPGKADAENDVTGVTVPVFDLGSPCGEANVSNPETQPGVKKFTSYQVHGYLGEQSFDTRKRYSDFVWFRSALCIALPGVFLPALPGKQTTGRFDPAFLEARRSCLEQFLRRLFQRQEISLGHPLLIRFLTTEPKECESMKGEIDHRLLPDILQDYQTAFAQLLGDNTAPKSDKGFIMVNKFLEKHVPLLRTSLTAAAAVIVSQDAHYTLVTNVGKAVQELCEDETDLLSKAQIENTELRKDMLVGLSQTIQIEKAGKSMHTLVASLQREIEDCESAQESLVSIDALQKRSLAKKCDIDTLNASRAALKGEEAKPVAGPARVAGEEVLTEGMRKRDKTSAFFGKMSTGIADLSAKAGINTHGRIAKLEEEIRKAQGEADTLDSLVEACRTVFSATEIDMFLRTKTAGCLWGQGEIVAQKLMVAQALTEIWTCSD